jgi:hypothetical protein
VDREQAKLVAGFRSTTRANTRLLTLVRAGLLHRVVVGTVRGGHKFLYSLTPRAARLERVRYRGRLRQHAVLAGNLFLEHQLRLNALYLDLMHRSSPQRAIRVRRWEVFDQLLSPHARVIPDAYIEIEGPQGLSPAFVEIDLGTESLHVWRKKTHAYLDLAISGEYQRLFGHPQFRVLVILPSDRRLETVRRAVNRVTQKIFWFVTFQSLEDAGFGSARWMRPTGSESYSFF